MQETYGVVGNDALLDAHLAARGLTPRPSADTASARDVQDEAILRFRLRHGGTRRARLNAAATADKVRGGNEHHT